MKTPKILKHWYTKNYSVIVYNNFKIGYKSNNFTAAIIQWFHLGFITIIRTIDK